MKQSDIQIVATGMCCSVGYSTAAASAAIRAEMDHFCETSFAGGGGKMVIGALLHEAKFWGPERYNWMFNHAVDECKQQLPDLNFATTALVLLLPEKNRPGVNLDWAKEMTRQLKYTFHHSSRMFNHGKTGLGSALIYAQLILFKNQVQHVLIVGVDSYFVPKTIHYYLSADRLLISDNNGFIPGEGAGAFVLQKASTQNRGLCITGIGLAQEEAHILQDELPNRAQGMTSAIRMALAQANRLPSQFNFHMSDISGEAYYFREISLALTRSFDQVIADFPHLTLASNVGETGAAIGPLSLAYLNTIMQRKDSPGKRALVHFSADSGERVVLAVEMN